MADIFETIGEAAQPIAGALDFLAPAPSSTPGQGMSLGSILKSVGQGVKDVVSEGPGAIAGGIQATFDPNSGMSARDRLLIGGMTALGVGVTARQLHQTWKASVTPDLVKAAPSGVNELAQLGDVRRFHTSPLGDLAAKRYPGINRRQAEILGAVDYDGVIGGIRRWDPSNAAAETHGRALFDQYATRVGSAEDAQVDWARFDHAMETGVFSGPNNETLRKQWRKLIESPQDLTPDETEELFGAVSAVADATGFAGHDMSVGIVGRIDRIEMSSNGPILYTRHPVGWVDGSANDPVVRTQRLQQLNYRQLAERGKAMLRTLYQQGMADWNRGDAPRRLPDELEVGPEWYPTARADVAKAFGLENVDSDALERAVASVSFLSEAEDWSTNIGKAKGVMTKPEVKDHALDGDFQSWLRSNKDRPYAGTRQDEHQDSFNQIHKQFTSAGFKVSKSDLGVVLRLMGEQESVAEIFASTARRKQKNFYLNIYHPDLEFPVTIDRHAFDAFLGLDTGIQDRPIDLSMSDGDQVYDVVGDTYRTLADELGIRPHELQAVVWETWRMLKRSSPKNGWARNDPFMLPEPDGSTNVVYEALNGRELVATGRSELVMPTDILKVNAEGLATAGLPDGTVAHIADITPDTAAKLRQFYPAVLGRDGVPRWAPIRPSNVQSIGQVRAALEGAGRGEAFLNASLGVHPVLDAGDTITFDLDPKAKLPKIRGVQASEIGRFESDEPELLMERLAPEQLDPKSFMDPERSPLVRNQWVAISAETPTGNRTNELRTEIQRRGYTPIEQQGRYTMDDGSVSEEVSFLVFGLSAEEGMELGAKYGQESVLVPAGLVYTDGSGNFMPQQGLEFGQPPEGSDRSLIQLPDGTAVTYSFDFDWSSDPIDYTPELTNRTTRVRRKVALKLPTRSNRTLTEVADELEKLGLSNVSIYTRRPELPGWARTVEHVYTDGVQTYAVRTLDGNLTAPNAGYVFTRSDADFPRTAPKVPSMGGTVEDLVASLSNVVATKRGDRWILEPAGEEVSSAIEAKHLLEQHGETGPFEIRSGGEKFEFPAEPRYPKRQSVLLQNGSFGPPLRRDSPLPDWERDFGFEFDPGYRVGNAKKTLDDRMIGELRGLTEMAFDGYADAFRRFRLGRVSVTPGMDPKHYAHIEWNAGGSIALNRDWFGDPERFMANLWDQRESGVLTPNADVSPASILAHEYGHMVHGAVALGQGSLNNPKVDKEIRQVLASEGRGNWRQNAQQRISQTAGSHPSEAVAEAFSELWAGKPSALSLKIVDLVTGRLQDVMKYRKVVGW